ncbi:4-hydroxybenzoate transporter PcaK [Corynebacterium comes]|uniref:4-hydroxybenzoate transporter PcaK n=2 Tax=Corynebacterium comes TaxID=2675218 RepID=A0A6B8WH20_9CORY|nr:4-hydroxybenzoate transporter PcaK [Corynebacterium comes]
MNTTTTNDTTLREKIDQRPMRARQWVIIGVAVLLMMTEGYDVQAMAFTSSAVLEDLGLNGSQLGMLLSAGLIGMAIGTAGVGPFADRYGRRPVLLASIAVNALGLFLTATADSTSEILIWRLVTGLGIGGIMTSGIVLVSEYANAKYRPLALSVYSAGFPIGATFGGLAAVPVIQNFGWQGVFYLGGSITLAVLVGVAVFIPESLDHLATRYRNGSEKAHGQATEIAHRLKIEGPIVLGSAESKTRSRSGYGALFSRENVRGTLLLWGMYFLVMSSFYFASSWTPRLLVEIGLTAEQGIWGGLVIMAGGLVGNILYGFCAARWDPRRVMVVFASLSATMMVAFATTTSTLFLALGIGLLLGVFINGCMAALYTIAPMSYTSDLRSTGVGMAMGIGRCGSILAPILVGGLLDIGWAPIAMYIMFAVVLLIVAGIAPALPRRQGVKENLSSSEGPGVSTPEKSFSYAAD